jgi:hypothetical protein
VTRGQRERLELNAKKLRALANLSARPDLDPSAAAARKACEIALRCERQMGLRLVLGGASP